MCDNTNHRNQSLNRFSWILNARNQLQQERERERERERETEIAISIHNITRNCKIISASVSTYVVYKFTQES